MVTQFRSIAEPGFYIILRKPPLFGGGCSCIHGNVEYKNSEFQFKNSSHIFLKTKHFVKLKLQKLKV